MSNFTNCPVDGHELDEIRFLLLTIAWVALKLVKTVQVEGYVKN